MTSTAPDAGAAGRSATDHDLVTAVAETLRRLAADPEALACAARTHGVSRDVMAASLVASCVADWMTRLPQPGADRDAVADAVEIEATRAAAAAGAGRPVALAVRLPPLLAIRLVELAGASKTTPEGAALAVLAAGVDPAFAATRRPGAPALRPWDGGTRRG